MKKIRLIGVYDYTVVLTYISLVITLVGISLAIEGSFRCFLPGVVRLM